MRERIVKEIELYFPYIYSDMKECRGIGYHEWLIELFDGERIIYDDFEKTIRNIHGDDIDEQTCRNEFGIRMRKIMWSKGILQEDLAEMTGIQRTQLSNYMNGKNSPSYYNAGKIAKALDCSLDDFRYK